jgi:hypothetical protein
MLLSIKGEEAKKWPDGNWEDWGIEGKLEANCFRRRLPGMGGKGNGRLADD